MPPSSSYLISHLIFYLLRVKSVLTCDKQCCNVFWWEQHQQHDVEHTAAEISVDLGVNCSISPEGTTFFQHKTLNYKQTLIYEQGFVQYTPWVLQISVNPNMLRKCSATWNQLLPQARRQSRMFRWFSYKSREYTPKGSCWHTPGSKTKPIAFNLPLHSNVSLIKSVMSAQRMNWGGVRLQVLL